MEIISSLTDLRTWIANSNPGNIMNSGGTPSIADVAEALRSADGRPAWGEDWSEWLDANAERIALETAEEV